MFLSLIKTSALSKKRTTKIASAIKHEIIIPSGLKPGEIIAITGNAHLHDNQKVRLKEVTTKEYN